MADSPKAPAEIVIGEAARGEGSAVAALAHLALTGAAPAVSEENQGSALAVGIDSYGGRLALPHGQGLCHVARADSQVVGMVYSLPPIRWLQSHPKEHRAGLLNELAEIELLAVAEGFRTRGIGSRLVDEVQAQARARGVQFVVAKVRAGQFATMRWYRHRGYTVAAQGEPLVFTTSSGRVTDVSDGADGYHLAIKPLRDATTLVRRTPTGRPAFLAAVTTPGAQKG